MVNEDHSQKLILIKFDHILLSDVASKQQLAIKALQIKWELIGTQTPALN